MDSHGPTIWEFESADLRFERPANHGHSLCVDWEGKSHGIVFIRFAQGATRNNKDLVAVSSPCDMNLCASDDDPFIVLLYDPDVKVRMRLFWIGGSKASISFHIGHTRTDGKVILL
jgi:hypothetical protein